MDLRFASVCAIYVVYMYTYVILCTHSIYHYLCTRGAIPSLHCKSQMNPLEQSITIQVFDAPAEAMKRTRPFQKRTSTCHGSQREGHQRHYSVSFNLILPAQLIQSSRNPCQACLHPLEQSVLLMEDAGLSCCNLWQEKNLRVRQHV